ncbi:hypothetical protein SteCoe_20447 [Stentor coeruleus]|uniref:Peptidase A1 domain-containing protein n=1 Tax=Stentor coeruleus TaxID=5963 RepID=A0A1R2BRY8_9CILI|nr:hypothetical protein SteCoe_20447 [Stentor coeruleus]
MKLLFLLCSLAFSIQRPLKAGSTFKIPLSKIKLSNSESQALKNALPLRKQKSFPSFLSNEAKITLQNIENVEFIGEVGVGSPPQPIKVIFDTGSGNFFVNSKLCQDSTCLAKPAFEPKDSSTFTNLDLDIDICFGSGEILGIMGQDTLTIGGLKVQNQHFAQVTQEIGDVFIDSLFSGLMGLGFGSLAFEGTSCVFDSIVNSEKLEWNVMSFYFSIFENEESELLIGDIDETKFVGEIHWVPVEPENPFYWTVIIDDVRLGDKTLNLCKEGCFAAIDTGTSLMSAPSDKLWIIYEHFDRKCTEITTYEDLIFVIDGKEYVIPPEDYIITITNGVEDDIGFHSDSFNECTLAFSAIDIDPPNGPIWVLGNTFMHHYYSIYDRDRMSVGLAKAAHLVDNMK